MTPATRPSDDRSPDARHLAPRVLHLLAVGRVLDVSIEDSGLTSILLANGLDAHNAEFNTMASLGNDQSDAVVCIDSLDRLDESEVDRAIAQLHRVTAAHLLVRISSSRQSDLQRTVKDRAWWEEKFLANGFRKSARYYAICPYEELEFEPPDVLIAMEKIPAGAAGAFPISWLKVERDLHMDMLRETGRRSDAHVARYQLASRQVRPGDRVLDAACGLGYGSHVLRHNSLASEVVGIDLSESAIRYATACFPGVKFVPGSLPEKLREFPDASFDFIASFETLEHLADPKALLKQFSRILRPGGRVIVSVPNQWVDETGKDPNPYHLQVYDFHRLKEEIAAEFLVDDAWTQIASGCRVASQNNNWLHGPRKLRRFDASAKELPDAEWWLLAGVKSPLGENAKTKYQETIFANVSSGNSPAGDFASSYLNPWLAHSMVHVGYRLHDATELKKVAGEVLQTAPSTSADFGGALCVLLYQAMDTKDFSGAQTASNLKLAETYLQIKPTNPHVFRWQVSLCFVLGRCAMLMADPTRAIAWFSKCLEMDSLAFSPHLATKTAESAYWAGRLSLSLGKSDEARQFWSRGLAFGKRLLASPMEKVLINPDYPNLFDHGDGMREFTLAIDFLTRCANGIHLLARQNAGTAVDWRLLDGSFVNLAGVLQSDLSESQRKVAKLNQEVDQARDELRARSIELAAFRQGHSDRIVELEAERALVRERTAELDVARVDLVSRTRELDLARAELVSRTKELDEERERLARIKKIQDRLRKRFADRKLRKS